MCGNGISRRTGFALLTTLGFAAAGLFAQPANAQTGNCWIDVKTGETPLLGPPGWRGPISDPQQVSYGGHNYAKQLDGSWLDAKTGEPPLLGPPGWRGPVSSPKQFFYGGHNYALVPCRAPIRTTNIRGVHPFIAFEGGGGWSNTNFDVIPNFGVGGSGFVGGVTGGVLFDLPGTTLSIGPRFGWQGGNMSGSTANPTASPFFVYDVKTKSVFYREALISIPIQRESAGFEKTFLGPGGTTLRMPFVTASVGVAEVRTQITGTSGAFQVTDGLTRTGLTFTGGIGIPIQQPIFGGTLDAYVQYRGINLPSGYVNIPGKVNTDFWAQGVNFGLQFRY